ncbi:GMC oxidoreductase [Sphingobium boeckii]|uniref:Choline dehydrogenase-like flavoprotein n=1 Tax=Sphingobium boeckii TaxID=1082345 RepID=A0A7W9EE05_9SPHN|nr:GMC family oxidoreductase [Sphingobium boeckii]MBB5685682.1 choline dehydrogenase-like flavoprotein [Sphingobium boeckii]
MFDAIVIGSGMSGGIAAKELCERGLKTLILERGRKLTHGEDYTDSLMPWELPHANKIPEDELADYPVQSQCYAMTAANKSFWVNDREHPYSTPDDKPFVWIRGYHLGGRSLMWARQSYRLSESDFAANGKDGHGSDWPIRYADIAPWYDHVEKFIGVSGSKEGLEQLPDGEFLPAMALNDAEVDFQSKIERSFPGRRVIPGRCAHLSEAKEHHLELGRNPCQYRSLCERGCSFGAYHSSLSSSLPAAERTGNLTTITDAIVHSLIQDPKTKKVTGVRVIDAHTKEGRIYEAKIVFLCASTIGTAQILLNSKSAENQTGLANSSDMVGRNLMDHVNTAGALGVYPGLLDRTYFGRRPTGFYIPRYRHVTEAAEFMRGYGFQGGISRAGWHEAAFATPGVGAEYKAAIRKPGPWTIFLSGYGEMLPNPDNRVTLHPNRIDQWGIPIPHIEISHGDNDRRVAKQMDLDAETMLIAAGATIIKATPPSGEADAQPVSIAAAGSGVHEMGTACMGKDPRTSVLNGFNQAHDVPNLFITDGSAMASTGTQNPSLTYMALSARAAYHATEFLKAGQV